MSVGQEQMTDWLLAPYDAIEIKLNHSVPATAHGEKSERLKEAYKMQKPYDFVCYLFIIF